MPGLLPEDTKITQPGAYPQNSAPRIAITDGTALGEGWAKRLRGITLQPPKEQDLPTVPQVREETLVPSYFSSSSSVYLVRCLGCTGHLC